MGNKSKRRRDKQPPAPHSAQPPAAIVSHTEARLEHHSGPLPDPATLEKYERLLPGAAERVFVMAEQEAAHRRKLETDHLVASIETTKARWREQHRGQWMGWSIAMLGLGCTAYAIRLNQPWVSSVIGAGTLASLVGVFIHGRRREAQEKE